jgi:hypothetical protein
MGRKSDSSDDDSTYRSEEDSDIEAPEKRKKKPSKERKSADSKGKKPQGSPPQTSSSKNVKTSEKHSAPRSKKRTVDDRSFDDLEVTLDMSDSMTDCKRVKLAPSLMIENKIVEVKDEETRKTYSYPAIVFLRRMKDGKVFEFNVPTNLARKLVEAVTVIALK